jgi:hypothetical protein
LRVSKGHFEPAGRAVGIDADEYLPSRVGDLADVAARVSKRCMAVEADAKEKP